MAGGYGRGQRAHSDSGSLVHKCRKGDEPIEETERGLAARGAGASMEDRTDGHAMQEEREEGSLNISARSKLQLSPKREREGTYDLLEIRASWGLLRLGMD